MKKRINITIATGLFPPSIGGPAQYSKLLLDEFPEYGFDITIATFDDVRKYPKIIRHIFYTLLLVRKSWSSDIIYAQDPVSVGLPALCVSKIFRKNFMLRVGGDYAWEQGVNRFGVRENLDEFVAHKQANFRVRLLQKIQSIVARSTDKVIAPSEYIKKIVQTWNVNPENIKVIYNAFITPKIIESSRSEGGGRIVSIGRLVSWKGFSELIDVVIGLREKYPNITLDIIGDGPLYKDLKKQITESSADSFIHMKGRMSHDDLYREISEANLFVLNTSYEGFSHLVLENMALGTPILTTSVGGNVEIIKHLKNGYLINKNKGELREGVDYMLGNEKQVIVFAKQAKIDIQKYTKENMLCELSDTIQKL